MVALAEDKISPADVVDAVNRRLRKTISNGGLPGNVPNGTTDCIWFGWQAMEERNPFGGTGSTDTPIRQYVWGTYIDELVQITTLATLGPQSLPAGAYYLLQDTLYRAMALTNSSGSVVEAYDTDAYGNTLIFTGPGADGTWFTDDDVQSSYGANEIIYCGYRYDPESENYYVRNRYYAPALGRWITRDPIGTQGGINLYAYVASNPAGKADPAGLSSWWHWLFPPGTSWGYMGMGGTVRRNPLPAPTPQSGWLGAIDNFLTWAGGHTGTTYYPPGSPDSRQMSQSTIGRRLVKFFANKFKGKPCSEWNQVTNYAGRFGVEDLIFNLDNGTAEFVGSATGSAVVVGRNCRGGRGAVTVEFTLKNVTSLQSFLYHAWGVANVPANGGPFANWTQYYEWKKIFRCSCCRPG